MSQTFQFELKRGLEANLPASAPSGEPYFTTDSHKLFMGMGNGNALVQVSGGGSTPSPIQTVTVNLTAADLIASADTPLQIIAAPAANKAIILLNAVISYTNGSHPFNDSGGTTTLMYDSITYFTGCTLPAGFWSSGNKVGVFLIPNTGLVSPRANVAGLPISLSAPVNVGAVNTVSLGSSGGSGYAPGDTGFLNSGDSNAEYAVDTVDGGGAVLTFHFTTFGAGNAVANDLTTTVDSGGGDGNLLINVLSITEGNGTATLTITYNVVDLG